MSIITRKFYKYTEVINALELGEIDQVKYCSPKTLLTLRKSNQLPTMSKDMEALVNFHADEAYFKSLDN